MCQRGGNWIAWGEDLGSSAEIRVPEGDPKYSMRLIQLTEQEVRNYYQGFSNRVMWPLCHYFVERCQFNNEYWKAYDTVNRKFAKTFISQFDDQSSIWIHDFHLTLLPGMLREARHNLSIGFFWHIPFPASPLFRVLPWREEVLRGMLGSDLIGFQLKIHADNFLQSVEDVLQLPIDRTRSQIEYEGRKVKVGAFPVGIDYVKWNALASTTSSEKMTKQIRNEVGVQHVLLGADRLDYTKGILERLLAYERFLEKYPKYRENVCFIQIAVPSRTQLQEYRTLRQKIDEIIGRISGRFSTGKWVPIRYLYRAYPMDRLAQYYAAADLALITPLRDGMNLVAEEYVASRIHDDGCLVLSEFAGAAGILKDAIVVNPYDIEGLADTIDRCLTMDESEKKRRMQRLRRALRNRDANWWCDTFLKSLAQNTAQPKLRIPNVIRTSPNPTVQ